MNKHEWVFMGMLLFCLLLMGGDAFAKQAELDLFPYVKHLAVEAGADHALGGFELDSEIFERATDNFSNMRVVDDMGVEILQYAQKLGLSRQSATGFLISMFAKMVARVS